MAATVPGGGLVKTSRLRYLWPLSALLWAVSLYAQVGQLDPTFGSGGIVILDLSPASADILWAAALQPDGKILAAGRTTAGDSVDFALLRFHPNGTLDMSFGGTGIVFADFSRTLQVARSIALQPDGKILLSGPILENLREIDHGVARFNPDGTLDPTFGMGGLVVGGFTRTDLGLALALQADGKFLVAGYDRSGPTATFALLRYDTDGVVDPSFGAGGLVTTNFPGPGDDMVFALLVDGEGRAVAVGSHDEDFALARYLEDGSLDSSFGVGGIVTTDFAGAVDGATDVALQNDGKFVVVGDSDAGTGADFALARYNPDGSLDGSFGTGGLVTSDITGAQSVDHASALTLQPDGKILVGGSSGLAGEDFVVARYNADGSLDADFGMEGIATTDLGGGPSDDEARNLVIQPDGKILLVGSTFNFTALHSFALARYLGDSPDLDAIAVPTLAPVGLALLTLWVGAGALLVLRRVQRTP
jgi:uncharacterized delta-60 repeat protein